MYQEHATFALIVGGTGLSFACYNLCLSLIRMKRNRASNKRVDTMKESEFHRQMKVIQSKDVDAKMLFPECFDTTLPTWRGYSASKAQNRAAQLLWDHLDDRQRHEAIREKTITIYHPKCALKISLSDPSSCWVKPSVSKSYYRACIHTNAIYTADPIIIADIVLTKKLAFEADPKGFLKTANY